MRLEMDTCYSKGRLLILSDRLIYLNVGRTTLIAHRFKTFATYFNMQIFLDMLKQKWQYYMSNHKKILSLYRI